jgi:membrane-associated phospholipid phosphatase
MGQLKTKLVIIFLILIPAAILTGIYDLEISKAIVNQNSVWARFLQNYGMIPGLIVIMSGVYIYYSFINSRSDIWSFFQRSIFFLVNSGLTYYLFEILLDKIVSDSLILFLAISFAINLIVFLIVHNRNPATSSSLIKYSKVVIGMALWGYVFGIQIVKFFWGRVRFRELDAAFAQFTPWYLPQGLTGFDSFPSGHAATGFMLLAILILFEKKKLWIKNLSLTLIIFWGILLAFSRVVIGAHYASDVLFGSFFIIITFLLLNRYYRKKV